MKSAAELAYEKDVQHTPTYHDGKPRKAWKDLPEVVRWSWERNPTPRHERATQ